MSEYTCVVRLKTNDGVIHEVGDTVALAGAEEESALRIGAVKPVALTQTTQPTPNLAELQKEASDIQAQIATMEHEGGVPS